MWAYSNVLVRSMEVVPVNSNIENSFTEHPSITVHPESGERGVDVHPRCFQPVYVRQSVSWFSGKLPQEKTLIEQCTVQGSSSIMVHIFTVNLLWNFFYGLSWFLDSPYLCTSWLQPPKFEHNDRKKIKVLTELKTIFWRWSTWPLQWVI